MIRHALERGVNYFDTAYVYHDGNSETVLGKALRGHRDRVKIATKSPLWLIQQEADFDRMLDEQLRKLQTDHIDFYLLHGMDKKRWNEVVPKFKLLEKAEAAIRDGRIRHLGFSFHDNYESFDEIVNGYDRWTFCQIQYNYMDTENQAGTRGLKLAASKGLAVVIMEPLLGGRLANPPASIRRVIERCQREALSGGLGVAMALGPARSVGGVKRHEQPGPGDSQPGFGGSRPQPFVSGGGPETDRRLAAKIPGTSRHSLHQVQLLHALPQRREHPGQF